MKIGIDASRANKPNKTGTEWYSYHVIKELAKLDKENQYLLYTRTPLEKGLLNLGKNFQEKILSWPPKWLWTQLRLSLEMLIKAPDLLYIPAHVVPLIHPKKTVTTLHDIAFERYPESYSRKGKFYLRLTTKFALKHAARIITVSEFTKKELVEVYGGNTDKIFPVHNGYDNENYRVIEDHPSTGSGSGESKIDQILKKYNIVRPFILSVGRLETKKNTARLIKSFDLLKQDSNFTDLNLVLVGQPGHGYKEVEKVLEVSPNKDKIIRPGWIEPQDIPYLMNAAEIFVMVSLYEGFGIPLIEAFACGCPVLASNIEATKEVVEDSALLVDPLEVNEISAKLKELLSNEELRNSLRARGLKRCQSFSWEKCGRETLGVLLSQ